MRTAFTTALFLGVTLTAPLSAAPPGPAAARTDALGDALPADAAFRLGTDRLRLSNRVSSLSFSPDGTSLASADRGGLVRVWDARSGKLRFELPADTGTTVVFSPDGKVLGTTGDRRPVRLWNASNGKPIRTLVEVGHRPLAFSPDGKSLLCNDHPDYVLLLDVESGKVIRRFEGIPYFAFALAFSADGKSVAACDESARLIVWDAANGKARFRITEHKQGQLFSLAFSPDGKLLASAGSYQVCLWDALTGKSQAEFNYPAANYGAIFDSTAKRLVTGGEVSVIDIASRKIVRRMMPDSPDRAGAVALSPDGKTIASGAGDDARIRLWDAETGKEKLAVGHLNVVHAVAVSPDGKLIAAAAGGLVQLWDAARGTEVRALKVRGEWDYWSRERWKFAVLFSTDGRTISAAGQTWDVTTGQEIERNTAPRSRHVAASPDGRTVVGPKETDDTNLGLVVRDAKGLHHRRLALPAAWHGDVRLGGMALSPDGRQLALAVLSDEARSSDPPAEAVRLWDVTNGKLRQALYPNDHVPTHLLFSPDGALLATSGTYGNPPTLWDVFTGRQLHQFADHMDRDDHWTSPNPIAFSPDGSLLALGGRKNTVVIVEAATGGVVRVLRGHTGPVAALAFSPDGRTLISGASDATALVWPVAPAGADRAWNADKADSLWEALEKEPAAAYPAVWAFAAAPDRAVPFLKERLRPDPEADERLVARWVTDLGADDFDVREGATKRLRDLGPSAEGALRNALKDQTDAERLRRLEDLLAALKTSERHPAVLRGLRAVLALEHMGTPAAEAVLEALARGGKTGLNTRAARAALLRLKEQRQRMRPGAVGAERTDPPSP
jgi:WD40 repeat protein